MLPLAELLIRERLAIEGEHSSAPLTRLSCGRRKSAAAPRILTLAQAHKVLAKNPQWRARLR
jgi:hypothetical protein